MAAAQANRPPREVVDFPLNVPVTVALKYGQGKTISSQYGERFMFSLVDGRVMFLDPQVAGQIASLGINVREDFSITKQSDGRNEPPIAWLVARGHRRVLQERPAMRIEGMRDADETDRGRQVLERKGLRDHGVRGLGAGAERTGRQATGRAGR